MSSRRQQQQQNNFYTAPQTPQQGEEYYFVDPSQASAQSGKISQRAIRQYMNDPQVIQFLRSVQRGQQGSQQQQGQKLGQYIQIGRDPDYEKVELPQQLRKPPQPTGIFGRMASMARSATSAAKSAVGIKSQQQVRQQQYKKKGNQVIGKLLQANKSNLNRAIAAIKKLKPRMPELTEEQMIRLQLLLAQPLNRVGFITLTPEDKFWLTAARARRSARKAYNRAASGITGATAAALSMFRSGGATGGAPKRKTNSKKSAKPKKKTMH
jgi:hypothetical protein